MTTPEAPPMSPTQRDAISQNLVQLIPDLTYADARNILLNHRAFANELTALFAKYSMQWPTIRAIMQWRSLYRSLFRLDFESGTLLIPPRRHGFNRLLIVTQGLTIDRLFRECKERFPAISKYPSLIDENITVNERDPASGSYAIWVRDSVEPDKRWNNRCAEEIRRQGITSETLLERHLHEIKFYFETGSHLDRNTVTLCSGSRDIEGFVPHMYWSSKSCLRIGWRDPQSTGSSMSTREVAA